MLVLFGCAGALLPEELVLGEELAAVEVAGEPLSQLGAGVAIGSIDGVPQIVVGAPGLGAVIGLDEDGVEQWRLTGEVGLGRKVWADGSAALGWLPGVGVLDDSGAVVLTAPQATALDRCPDGSWETATGIGDALACSEAGLLRSTCSGAGCTVTLTTDATVTLGETSAGSAVGFIEGVACWGDATLEDDPTPGLLRCEDGTEIAGLDGDHLGAVIGAGMVAGVFNKWQVPARVRMVAPDGTTWSIDRAAERSRVALAEGEGIVAVGVPGYISQAASEGRVYLVRR